MPAGVHDAGARGAPLHRRRLDDGQRVQLGAEANSGSVGADPRPGAGVGDGGPVEPVRCGLEPVARGLLLAAEVRVGVDLAAQGDGVGQRAVDARGEVVEQPVRHEG